LILEFLSNCLILSFVMPMRATLQFVRIPESDDSDGSGRAAAIFAPTDLPAPFALSGEELARMARWRREADRLRFAVTRTALREMLGQELGIAPGEVALETGEHGRPKLAGGEGRLDFNESHAGQWGLIACVRGARIGVDVERVDAVADPREFWQACLHPHEQQTLTRLGGWSGAHAREAFHWLWCAKEAAFKALGTGLQEGLPMLSLDVARLWRQVEAMGGVFDAGRPPVLPDVPLAWHAHDEALIRALAGMTLHLLPAPPGYGAAVALLPVASMAPAAPVVRAEARWWGGG
jgi:4'-phosphopantetheinyl transferase